MLILYVCVMNIFKKLLLLYVLLATEQLFAQSYTVSPTVPDFTDLEASCVVATSGDTENPFKRTGVVNGRHTIITEQGTDSYTEGELKFLPDSESKVIRLGNSDSDSQAESITYHFIADKEKSILLLKFAVVFEDPNHPYDAQPRFVVRIMNSAGELIESCAKYDISARPEINGFQNSPGFGIPVRWRNWTNIGLDMSRYAGQEIQLQFITYDCGYGAHYGYAYFSASCISNKLDLVNCNGKDLTLSAPQGFTSYLWNNGVTTPTISCTMDGDDMSFSCDLTSVTGCRFTLSAYVSADGNIPQESHTYYDTICQGEVYIDHDYELPPQSEAGNFTFYNSYFDLSNCKGDITTTLFLRVIQRYYPVKAEICYGEDYTGHGFSYIKPPPGIIRDTLWCSSPSGCDSLVTLKLIVSTEFSSQNLVGNPSPCMGAIETYYLPDTGDGFDYLWEIPRGFNILSGVGTPEIRIQATDKMTAGTIILNSANGCGSGTVSLTITPKETSWIGITDSICSGEEYHENGFHIPARDTLGFHTYVSFNKNSFGCDSIVTLYLGVYPIPDVKVLASDEVVCDGKVVQLQTLPKNASGIDSLPPQINIGDILCTDKSIIKPKDYVASGKTATGIIFWVNKSGKHGWVINLRNQCSGCSWMSNTAIPFPKTTKLHLDHQTAVADTFGYRNTAEVIGYKDIAPSEVLNSIDFDNGWYIPTVSQLNLIYSAIPYLNASLTIVSGTGIGYGRKFWSSTQQNPYNNWVLNFDGTGNIEYLSRTKKFAVRTIKNF